VGRFQKLAVSGASAAVIAVAVAGTFEGVRHTAYLDVTGTPTICYGRTHGVYPGMTATQAECRAWLTQDMRRADAGIQRCVSKPLTDSQRAALDDLAYNVGVGAVCRSSMVRLINAGAAPDVWCKHILRYVYADGQVLPGLVKRRRAEYEICVNES
jgi:lysozyme